MRINKFIAQATGISRRAADAAIAAGRVRLNQQPPEQGAQVGNRDIVTLDGKQLKPAAETLTLMLNKPAGYVCSRAGQGSQTVYDLLPSEYQALKPVGRLDKDSSGLILLTNDGELAHRLTHPRYAKQKIYEIALDKPLEPLHHQMVNDFGVQLEDGLSRLQTEKLEDDRHWRIIMSEGRNRQIRRTFASLGYTVRALHRTNFGNYALENLAPGTLKIVNETN